MADPGDHRPPIRVLLAVANPERERRLRDVLSAEGLVVAERCLDGPSLAERAQAFDADVALASTDLHRFLAVFPLMNIVGVHPFGAWAVWMWLAGFAVGFALPDWMLEGRLERRRTTLLMELPTVLDLLAISASAGMSPEQALLDVSRQVGGVLGDGLRGVVREAGLGAATHAEGLRTLAEREGVPELLSMADAWQSALEQGLPLGQAMLTLAETVRERKRARLLEEGGKSTVRMLFPVALFIFPVFLVVLLYPAGVELLGLGG